MFAACDSALVAARLRVLRATADYHGGRVADAGRALAVARADLERLGLLPELWQVLRVLGWCARRLGGTTTERRALVRESEAVLDRIAAGLPPEEAAVYRLNKWVEDETYLVSEVEELVELRAAAAAAPWYRRPAARWAVTRRLAALADRLDRYRAAAGRPAEDDPAIDAAAAGLQPAAPPQRPPVWRRLFGHPRRRETVAFLVLPDWVFVLRAGWMRLDFAIYPVTRVRVRELVGAWHRAVRGGGAADEADGADGADRAEAPAAFTQTAADVVKELAAAIGLPQVLDRLARSTRSLTIVPDNVLHGFPFAAVRHRDRYLIEDRAVSIAYHTGARAAVPRPADRRGPRGPRKPVAALLVGVSRAGAATDGTEVPELPGCGPS